MCEKPIRIRNNSKYINTKSGGQQYYMWVNCGHCKECIIQKQNEWNLRTFYKFKETLENNGWIYFDTLTYRQETLPRISEFVDYYKNWQCFRPKDIREFYEKLRGWYGDKSFDYFIVSEYGKTRKRVHYHILLFVKDQNIDKIKFSEDVSKAWGKGRTDGRPYKSKRYVQNHNIIETLNLDIIKYVVKYITKSIAAYNTILERWNKIEYYLEHHEKHKYDKIKIKRIKRQYLNNTMPFHRESRGHGLNALLEANIDEIINENRMHYRDNTLNIIQYCTTPTYFKRKLFQKTIKVNGKRIWIYTEKGIEVKKQQEQLLKEKLIDRIKDLNRQNNKNYEDQIEEIVNYILFERGRFNTNITYRSTHENPEYYNYNTDRDQIYLGKKTISKTFAGNDTIGYKTTDIEPIDIEELVIIKPDLERIINELMIYKDNTTLLLLKEHMNEIKKIFFQNT